MTRRRVLVGVVLHTDPRALHRTLDAAADALGDGDRMVLVPDGPDPAMAAALREDGRLARLAQLATDRPEGNAAAFNRLARALGPDEGAVVFLENGARPAPDALGRLARALDRTGVAVAGPSTNDAWNEQRALPDGRGDRAGLREGAAQLAAIHGDEQRSLAPLYSLAEVGFAVSREAIAAVGAADEGFGLGPCWEMEYTARAARAGFDTVWVCSAYVHRSPLTRRRHATEALWFTSSKQRYQDRLCGLRLDGTRTHYVDHCDGDACPHFAPAGRIVVRVPLGTSATPARAVTRFSRPAAIPRSQGRRRPFVSCVMVTSDRAEWARQAIGYFHRQTYPADARELIVVDDGDVDLRRELGSILDHAAITYVRLARRESIGAKRNLGSARARGDVLVQWDDDDWYGPQRIARQVAPIVDTTADITGLRDAVWFDIQRWCFRQPTPAHHSHLFVQDVAGGTLVFDRSVWDRGVRYPNTSLAEDAAFVRQAVYRGARLARIPAGGIYIYVRHGRNSWQLRSRDERNGWRPVEEPDELVAHPDDRAWYLTSAARSSSGARQPVARRAVSCIMPTADRLGFLPAAIEGFLAQTYTDAELVVVDDGEEAAADLLPADPRVRYLRLDRRRTLGEKRNLAVEAAEGEVVVHFDDDDWSHPERIAVQVGALASGNAEVCGLAHMLWWDPERRVAWRYTCPRLHRPWVAGNTLAYLRTTWRRAPFPPQATGEDTAFLWATPRRVHALDDERLVIGTLHSRNSSPKRGPGSNWATVDPDEVLNILGEARMGAQLR